MTSTTAAVSAAVRIERAVGVFGHGLNDQAAGRDWTFARLGRAAGAGRIYQDALNPIETLTMRHDPNQDRDVLEGRP